MQRVQETYRKTSNLCSPANLTSRLGGGSRLLRCIKFSDSHAYVLEIEQARRILAAHSRLIEQDGRGAGHCEDPWGRHGCADDPALLGAFFKLLEGALQKWDGAFQI